MPTLVNQPKFAQLAAILERRIDAGELAPGHKLPGERALAKKYGVSHMTVNKALAGLVSKGLLERRQGDGTYIAEPEPASTSTQTAAVMLDTRADMHDPFLHDLSPFLQQCGLYPMLLHWQKVLDDPAPLARLLAEAPPTFIANGRCGLPLETLRQRSPNTRLIVLGSIAAPPTLTGSYILNDFHAGGRLAARHLLDAGCRNFLVLGPPGAGTPAELELDGFLYRACQAIQNAGARLQVVRAAQTGAEDYARIFSRPDRPDGVISLNDFRLVTAVKAAREVGLRFPDDIRAVGQHNTPWAVTAELSSVGFDIARMLKEVKEILHGAEDRTLSIEPLLHIRGSSGL